MFSMQWSRQHGSQARTVCTEGMVGVSGATSKALTAAGVVGRGAAHVVESDSCRQGRRPSEQWHEQGQQLPGSVPSGAQTRWRSQ